MYYVHKTYALTRPPPKAQVPELISRAAPQPQRVYGSLFSPDALGVRSFSDCCTLHVRTLHARNPPIVTTSHVSCVERICVLTMVLDHAP